MPGLKLVSINIERSKHLDRAVPFIESEQPDVLCVHELRERDIPLFEQGAGPCITYAPIVVFPPEEGYTEGPTIVGSAIFSRRTPLSKTVRYYRGSEDRVRMSPPAGKMENPSVSVCDFDCEGDIMRIATTHFTWTPDGQADFRERSDVQALIEALESFKELALCGDFNAPRGGEIFADLSRVYTDNIPLSYKTSLDVNLHRAGKDHPEEIADKMVDGLFTTPGYHARDVRLQDGVSDHMAIVATIEKA